MIYLELFLGFLKVGLFSFGGAYAAIPLIRETVVAYGWLSDEALSYMIAVSESTPGPLMVNLATYVGSTMGGVLGALIATFAVVFPAFVIILLVMVLFRALLKNQFFTVTLGGLKSSVIGVILAIGAYMFLNNVFTLKAGVSFDWRSVTVAALLLAFAFLPKAFKKKQPSPILLIAVSAVLGLVFYSI